MKKIVLSLSIIGFIGVAAIGATGAFFNDTETSSGNTFTAGSIDLKVDSEQHYNNMVCVEVDDDIYQWEAEDGFQPGNGHVPEPGSECDGTWTETDLGPSHTFFNFGDLKPGDHGENTISLHVLNNDAYMCAIIDNMIDNDNGCTEPEGDVDGSCGNPGVGEGELSNSIRFFAWDDDGDNIWQGEEQVLFSNVSGPAGDVIDGVVYPMFVPQTEAITGSTTEYIGLYWCFGEIDASTPGTLLCDGSAEGNITQTDSLSADISFYVEQARHNENFVCPQIEEEPEPQP